MRHALFRSIGRPRRAIVLLMALPVALVAGPAGAATGTHGEASGEGEEVEITLGQDYGTATQPFCFEVLSSTYRVDVTGEFYGDGDGDGQSAAYVGPAELNWETTETYYIAPEGIYTDLHENPVTGETECDPDSLGDQVEAHVWVDPVSPPDGHIQGCESTEKAYSRLDSEIEVAWEGNCAIETSPELRGPLYEDTDTTDDVNHLFEGTLDAGTGTVAGTWVYPDPT